MSIDPLLTIASFGIGIVVGLTGMGGGALMTPVLVLFFNIPPLTAVSSDLVASAIMKPVGSAVHLRRGTVHMGLVKWLCIGSIPGAFSGVLIARALGHGAEVQEIVRTALGVALLLAAIGLIVRAYLRLLEYARRRDGRAPPLPQGPPTVELKVMPTILVGAVGGVVVGLTSVGSGSLIIIALMALYPALKANELVGTDLVQAVPLVLAAAISNIALNGLDCGILVPLVIGSVPGTLIGARIAPRVPQSFIRRGIVVVLSMSGVALLDKAGWAPLGKDETHPVLIAVVGLVMVVLVPLIWGVLRRQQGLPMFGTPTVAQLEDPEYVGGRRRG
ncbi:MAG: sulfite exporter TauE/SafE family protein [Gemmatimonadota bacterium]|nr:sulfite exporter TauE/SafE family protein [Gemmatimonadota bacterium]